MDTRYLRRCHTQRGLARVVDVCADRVALSAQSTPGARSACLERERRPREGLEHFNIGSDRMPKGVYHAYGYVKEVVTIEPQIEDLMALFYERIGQLTAGHGLGKNYWRGCR